jgi:thiamine pyrophosphokinase
LNAAIIANGRLQHPLNDLGAELIIAADGGLRHCLDFGIHPDYVVGDLDSINVDLYESFIRKGTQFITHPSRKDQTDLEIALEYAIELGASEVCLYAAVGDRWDQTIANILLPLSYPNAMITIMDGPQEIHYLNPGKNAAIDTKIGDLVSLIPLNGDVTGIFTDGLEYPLHNEELRFGFTRGISNVAKDRNISVRFDDGELICVIYRTNSQINEDLKHEP